MTRGFDQLAGELRRAEQRRAAGARRQRRARGLLLPLVTTAVVAAVLTVVLLTGTGTRHPAAAGRGPGPSPVSAHGQGHWRLPCSEFVGHVPPARGMRVVLGAVALSGRLGESRALQTGRDGARLFAKSGLWVRSGARFELVLSAGLRRRVTMSWGNAGEGNHGAAMTDPGCRVGHTRWINYVGGYWVKHPLCATLMVTSNGRRRRVRIGIGTPCPGQRPPAAPSQS